MKIIKTSLAFISTICVSVLLVITTCIFCVSSFANKENITKKMKKTDLLTEIKKIKNSGAKNSNSKLTNAINDMYSLASQFNVDEKVVDAIIDSKITKEIIGDAIGNLTDYAINGKNTKMLSEQDTYNLINNNLDDILKEQNITLTDSQKEKFLREIKKQLPDIIQLVPNSKVLLGTNNNKIKIIQKIFSNKTKVITSILLITSIIIVIILKKENYAWLNNISLAFLLSSLVTIGLSLLLPSIIVTAMSEADLSLFVSSLTDFIAKPILYSGLITLIISIILFIINKKCQHKIHFECN